MPNDTDPALIAAVSRLPDSARTLLLEYGFEDRRAIIWATFSDDKGVTRIVFRSYRKDASQAFSFLRAADLQERLENARDHGVTKEFWGLDDGNVD